MKKINIRFPSRPERRRGHSQSVANSSRLCREVAILHLDIVGSTYLVRQNIVFAHHQIQQLYRRITEICVNNSGVARELRGDAIVAEFENAEDALKAAISIQSMNRMLVGNRLGRLNPPMRIGISFGEILSDDNITTGLPVIRAQRLEQIAEPDQIIVDERFRIQLSQDVRNRLEYVATTKLKGLDESVDIYRPVIEDLNLTPDLLPGTIMHSSSSC